MLKIQLVKEDPIITDDTMVLQYNGANHSLLVTPSRDGAMPTFFYTLFNSTFRIENATHVEYLYDLEENDGFTRQIVLIISDNILYIVPFCSYHNRKDILRDYPATFKILAHVEAKYLYPSLVNNSKDDYSHKVRIMRQNGFYYINWNPFENPENNKPAMLVRFNSRQASKYIVPSDATPIFDSTDYCTFIRYLVTDKEIFDVISFTTYDLGDLFSSYNLDYRVLFFRIFSVAEKKLLFVSKEPVDFGGLRNRSSVLISKSTYVEGFIYDLSSNQMILNEDVDSIWHKFFLYDDGLPHIFKENSLDGSVEFHVIRYRKASESFDTIVSETKPIVVSYTLDRTVADSKNSYTRFIFLTKKGDTVYAKNEQSSSDDKNLMMAFNENLEMICFDDYIELEAINFCRQNSTCTVAKQNNTNIFHLAGNDSIILSSCKGEFGEFILMFLNESIKINYLLSFFGYQRAVLNFDSNGVSKKVYENSKFLLVNTRKNDFENTDYVINLQSHKIYTTDEFVALLGSSN